MHIDFPIESVGGKEEEEEERKKWKPSSGSCLLHAGAVAAAGFMHGDFFSPLYLSTPDTRKVGKKGLIPN